MKLENPDARAPHWPRGTVGRFYVKKDPAWGDAQGLMAVEQLPIRNVRRIDGGFVILAGEKGEYLFQVDANGESAECVPWDEEMEREFQLYGEDIPPTYDMPEPAPEATQAAQAAPVAEPIGLVAQTDPGLYRTEPEGPYDRAVSQAREWIRRDAEMARQREAEAAAVDAHVEAERARQEAGK